LSWVAARHGDPSSALHGIKGCWILREEKRYTAIASCLPALRHCAASTFSARLIENIGANC
jgi:hypothetical protein